MQHPWKLVLQTRHTKAEDLKIFLSCGQGGKSGHFCQIYGRIRHGSEFTCLNSCFLNFTSHPEFPLPGSCNAWSHVGNEAGQNQYYWLPWAVCTCPSFCVRAVSDPGEYQKNQDLNCNLNQIVLLVDSGHYSCLGKSLNSEILKLWVVGPKNYYSNVSLRKEGRKQAKFINSLEGGNSASSHCFYV